MKPSVVLPGVEGRILELVHAMRGRETKVNQGRDSVGVQVQKSCPVVARCRDAGRYTSLVVIWASSKAVPRPRWTAYTYLENCCKHKIDFLNRFN